MKIEKTRLVSPALKCYLILPTSCSKCFRTCIPELRVVSKKPKSRTMISLINRFIITFTFRQILILMDMHPSSSDKRVNELVEILSEKEGLIKQLIDRCDRQEKRMTKILSEQRVDQAKKVPFSFFKPFLISPPRAPANDTFLLFRVKNNTAVNKQPIWISTNLELTVFEGLSSESLPVGTKQKEQLRQIGIQKAQSKVGEEIFETQLTKDVDKLKENIGKCQSLIQSLKELKQLQLAEKDQEQKMHSPPRQLDNVETMELNKNIKELQQQLFKLTVSNQRLRERVAHLQEAEATYLTTIRDLEEKLGKGSKLDFTNTDKSKISERQKPKKEKHSKIILLNY